MAMKNSNPNCFAFAYILQRFQAFTKKEGFHKKQSPHSSQPNGPTLGSKHNLEKTLTIPAIDRAEYKLR